MLNARQEKFVQNLVASGMNATAAYKAAGYGAKTDGAARAGASEILANPNVQARVAELQIQAARKAEKTVESLVADLDRAIELAIQNRQTSAMVSAIATQAKLLGLIVDRSETEILQKPSRVPTARVELSMEEWQRQFNPKYGLSS